MLGNSKSIRAKNRVVPVSRAELIGKNSTTFVDGEAVKAVSGVATPAGATGEIYGWAIVDRTTDGIAFAANNESVGLQTLSVEVADPQNERVMGTDGSTATVGVLYKLDTNKLVDVSAGAQTDDAQVEVTEVISASYVKVRTL